MPFPNIDPVAFAIGPFAVRWYALAYLAGVVLGAAYATTLLGNARLWKDNRAPFPPGAIWDFAFWAVIGIVVGGRLGYVLFYNLPYYASHPADIIALWDGGMSFHGGLAGIMIAMALFTRAHGGRILSGLDLLGAIGTIGLLLGRIANFINGELYGAPTTLPWGVIFPSDPQQLPRHPSQLYEGALEGIVLFLIIRVATHVFGGLRKPGLVAGIFGMGYAAARIFVEFFRLPDAVASGDPNTTLPGYLFGTGWITEGMVLSVPVFIAGVALAAWALVKNRA